MSSSFKNFSAFPHYNVQNNCEDTGLSLFEHFVTHAPARPEWFQAQDIPAKPEAIWQDKDGNPAIGQYETNPETQRLRQNILVNEAEFKAWEEMEAEEKEFQWPFYWAKKMLKRLGYSE